MNEQGGEIMRIKKSTRGTLVGFAQILYYYFHFCLEQVLAVLVVAYGAELLLHVGTLPYPSAEVARGGVFRHVGEVHHGQFVLLVGAQAEGVFRLPGLYVCHRSLCFILRKDTKNGADGQVIFGVYWQFVRRGTVFSFFSFMKKRGQV